MRACSVCVWCACVRVVCACVRAVCACVRVVCACSVCACVRVVCVRVCVCAAERRGGALFIERPLLPINALLALPSLASLFRQGIGCRCGFRAGAFFAPSHMIADVRSSSSCFDFVMASAAERLPCRRLVRHGIGCREGCRADA